MVDSLPLIKISTRLNKNKRITFVFFQNTKQPFFEAFSSANLKQLLTNTIKNVNIYIVESGFIFVQFSDCFCSHIDRTTKGTLMCRRRRYENIGNFKLQTSFSNFYWKSMPSLEHGDFQDRN